MDILNSLKPDVLALVGASVAYDGNDKLVLQILNVIAFIICMTANGLSQVVSEWSLRDITDYWNNRIDPDTYAFSIWGLIYSLMGMFVVYQALPDSWVPERNDELIFGKISYAFMVNMLMNAFWLVIFQTNTIWGFILSFLQIVVILGTNLYMMMMSTRSETNWVEWISIRGGFSIYSGWVTAATILNATYMLKSWGLNETDVDWLNEEYAAVAMVWIAFVVYNLATYIDRNPLYGAVFIWVITAIRNNVVENKSELTTLETNADWITVIHSISIVAWAAHLATLSFFDADPADMGLFY